MDDLEYNISLAKITRTQKLEELCLKQAELDAIQLQTNQV